MQGLRGIIKQFEDYRGRKPAVYMPVGALVMYRQLKRLEGQMEIALNKQGLWPVVKACQKILGSEVEK